ncbi:MAG TPA: sigma-54 dependent transcriptional regulator [Polyangiaceae bacterium]|nr:sigma-54 dependent transcriptional regulator [Polyangiaceae bacterium]
MIESRVEAEPRSRESASDVREVLNGSSVRPSVLLVDDEALIRLTLRERLEAAGYEISEAVSGAQARSEFAKSPDLVFLDFRLPDADGLTLLRELKELSPETLVICLTAHGTLQTAVDAMAAGAFYFLTKPFDVEQVALLAARALETTHLQREVRALSQRTADLDVGAQLLGVSPAMREVRSLVQSFARSPASTVLITGESGVGKDVAARALHAQSDRAGHPFVNITCSALPEALLESELFGHERGAFTDAKQRKKGLFEQAHGGTVFLDEMGEMTLSLQAKLLRFLEEKAFRRVGGSEDIRPNVRIIAATNRDLSAAVAAGHFREDLYYRLAVLHVPIPPLRERSEDVEALAKFFVDRFNRAFHKRVRGISKDALAQLRAYAWPGNVRELRNVLERALLLCSGTELRAADLRLNVSSEGRPGGARAFPDLPAEGLDVERLIDHLVTQALQRTRGNRTRAGALLGMTRDQIRYRIEKCGLEDSAADLDDTQRFDRER